MELQLSDQLNRLEDKLDCLILYLQWAHPGLLRGIEVVQAQVNEEFERGRSKP